MQGQPGDQVGTAPAAATVAMGAPIIPTGMAAAGVTPLPFTQVRCLSQQQRLYALLHSTRLHTKHRTALGGRKRERERERASGAPDDAASPPPPHTHTPTSNRPHSQGGSHRKGTLRNTLKDMRCSSTRSQYIRKATHHNNKAGTSVALGWKPFWLDV
jgi:hypothetical protein